MLSAYQTLDDEGTVTFSTGDQMTVGYDGEFYVDAGLIYQRLTFISGGSSNVDFTSAASPHWRHQLVQRLPVYVPYTLVPRRSRAMLPASIQILITSATMPGGATLSAQPDRQPTRA